MQKLLQDEEEKLYQLFLYKTGDPQESRDLLQDLYESALKNLDSLALVEDQAAWLFRAAHNKITDWYRKRSRKKVFSLDEKDEDDRPLTDLLADFEGLEDRFFRESLYEALYQAIEALPERLAAVVKAQALDGQTFRELSEEWEIPMGTLLSRKREAMGLLKDALEDFSDVWYGMNRESGGFL